MKKTFRYMAAATAVLAAFSCAKQEINAPEEGSTPPNTYEYVLNVTQEGDSKTTMDGNSILWSADDKIAVMGTDSDGAYKSGTVAGEQSIYVPEGEEFVASTQATFTLILPDGFTPMVATYPFDGANSLENKGDTESTLACRFYIPAEQTGVKDNLPIDAFPMVGRIVDGKCMMHNAGALIKFDITNTDIVSIKFEANSFQKTSSKYIGCISGRNYYYADSGIFARGTSNSENSVTLTPAEADVVFEPGSYYLAVAPQNLSDGFTITITDRFGKQAVRKTNKPFNIERNHKYTNFGSDEGWFKDIYTASAGDLGSIDGTTATLYGILRGEYETDAFGFEISEDGTTWDEFTGTVSVVSSQTDESISMTNTFSAQMTGLTPGKEYFYRARYVAESGIITNGKAKSFKTIADEGAECVKINLYNAPIQWPFTNQEYDSKEEGLKRGNTSNNAPNYGGTATELTLTDGKSFVVKATDGMWLNINNACLTIKGKQGDYIKFPVIEGKKPVSVSIVYGSTQSTTITNLNKDNNNQGLLSVNKVIGENSGTTGGGGKYDPRPVYMYDSHTWELENTDDGQYELYFNTAYSSNCYIAYLEVNYTDYVTSGPQESIVNYMEFSTRTGTSGGGSTWPFATDYTSYKTATSPVGPLYTSTYPDFQYRFYVTKLPMTDTLPSDNSEDYKKDYWRYTANGLQFGSDAGDYMEIMPVENYRVTKIQFRSGSNSNTYTVTDASGRSLAEPIAGATDKDIVFDLSDTTKDTEYRLVLGDVEKKSGVIYPSSIREMWITYELVK